MICIFLVGRVIHKNPNDIYIRVGGHRDVYCCASPLFQTRIVTYREESICMAYLIRLAKLSFI